jgi:hypothetical protein
MRKQREKRDLHCDLHRENSGTCIDKAKRFYARYEFESLPDQPLTPWLPMTALARLFPEA